MFSVISSHFIFYNHGDQLVTLNFENFRANIILAMMVFGESIGYLFYVLEWT